MKNTKKSFDEIRKAAAGGYAGEQNMIVVAGKNNIAVHALNVLVSKVGAAAVVAVPNTSDTGEDGWQQSLLKASKLLGVQTATLKELEGNTKITRFISLQCDKIIDPDRFPSARAFNIHFSNLPKYKGMYTTYWPIYNGDRTAGVTLHKIFRGIDTGDIIGKKIFSVGNKDRAYDIYLKYIINSIELFDEYIDRVLSGNISFFTQPRSRSTYYSKKSINYSEARIDLAATAWQIQRQVYAYSFRPYQLPKIYDRPVAEVEITGRESTSKPGTIMHQLANCMTISTIDFDVKVYFDELEDFLSRIPKISIVDFKRGLKHIAGIHDRNEKGWSPLIVAIYCGRIDIVRYLLSLGASINDTNYKGTSTLMYSKEHCLSSSNRSMYDFLIEKGADVGLKDFSGRRLVDYLNPEQRNFFGISF